MAAITEEMIWAAFDEGMAVRNGQKTIGVATDALNKRFGLDLGTAKIHIDDLHHMLEGKVFKRALSLIAIRIYLQRIIDELGRDAFEKAIESIKKHIKYREEENGVNQPGLRAILAEFENTTPQR